VIASAKYDDASWHYDGDFPKDLPHEAGGTHIAMFVAWAALNGMAGAIHKDDFAKDLALLRDRKITPGAWIFQVADGKFSDQDLNDEGNAFAGSYFETPDGKAVSPYLEDYERCFPSVPSLYHVDDSWLSYDRLAPMINRRFKEWRRGKQRWWKKLLQ
jgi:hypothetical protein